MGLLLCFDSFVLYMLSCTQCSVAKVALHSSLCKLFQAQAFFVFAPSLLPTAWESSDSKIIQDHELVATVGCRGSALVAMDLGFMGPNYSISTACATANYCFVAAANHIRKGDADIIIAGGSEAPIIPVGLGGFVACRWALLLLCMAWNNIAHCICLISHDH